jgi:hypothetical protein
MVGPGEIQRFAAFDPAENYLDKFCADASESKIEITFKVDDQDIKNIATINQSKKEIKSALGHYKILYSSGSIIDEVENWKLGELAENQELVYCIVNNVLVPPSLNSRELIYLNFLNYYELLSIVIQKAIDLELLPLDTRLSQKYVYFSPYRGGDTLFQVSLAGESYYNLLNQYTLHKRDGSMKCLPRLKDTKTIGMQMKKLS